MDTRTCLVTSALPRRLRRKPDQPDQATLAVVPACRMLTHCCEPVANPAAAMHRSDQGLSSLSKAFSKSTKRRTPGCSRRAGSTPGALRVWNLAPREGGLHDRWSDRTDSCHGEAASLVIGCAVDPRIRCGLLYLSVRIAETLAIGNIDGYVSLLHARKEKKAKRRKRRLWIFLFLSWRRLTCLSIIANHRRLSHPEEITLVKTPWLPRAEMLCEGWASKYSGEMAARSAQKASSSRT